jgi:glycosyltransferase involved in cell wall biosynthesis
MRVLVLSSIFPSRTQPTLGVFVKERVRHVAARAAVVVIAPVPWFPLNRWIRGSGVAATPLVEIQNGLTVYHPRFLCLPLVGKSLDALLYALSVWPFLTWLRRRFPFDIIDAHFTFPDGVAATVLGRVFRRRVCVTIRGPHDIRHAGFRLRRWQIRFALRAAARLISVSESLRHFAVSLGAERDKIRVLPNGVDATRFFPSDRKVARDRLGLPQDRVILLAVGSLGERKGHQRMIELLPRLVMKRPELLYVAVGDEIPGMKYRHFLDTLIRRLGLAGHVRIIGPRPHDEIQVWMAAANLFCLATRAEGWCNALTEALACGLPVVTTRVGGNVELVRDGRDGLLVPFWNGAGFGTAILRALEHSWDRDDIARTAASNDWDKTADQVLQEFRHALSPRSPS